MVLRTCLANARSLLDTLAHTDLMLSILAIAVKYAVLLVIGDVFYAEPPITDKVGHFTGDLRRAVATYELQWDASAQPSSPPVFGWAASGRSLYQPTP